MVSVGGETGLESLNGLRNWDKCFFVCVSSGWMSRSVCRLTASVYVSVARYQEKHDCPSSDLQITMSESPRGLIFTWCDSYGLYFWHKPTELARSFFIPFLCLFLSSVYDPFNCISFYKFSRQLSAFSFCSSTSYFCLIRSFQLYISLCESLIQPWCNRLWLTGLKVPAN